jgi:hypothetical protein
MRAAHLLGVSPLGPYHYKMISEDFMFDTSKIKRKLGWNPTVSNEEMLWRAYKFYRDNKLQLTFGPDVPAHRQPVQLGSLRILKWVS